MRLPSEKAYNLVSAAMVASATGRGVTEAQTDLLAYVAGLEADRARLEWCADNRVHFLGSMRQMDWPGGDEEHWIEWLRCGYEVNEVRARPDARAAVDRAMAQPDGVEVAK